MGWPRTISTYRSCSGLGSEGCDSWLVRLPPHPQPFHKGPATPSATGSASCHASLEAPTSHTASLEATSRPPNARTPPSGLVALSGCPSTTQGPAKTSREVPHRPPSALAAFRKARPRCQEGRSPLGGQATCVHAGLCHTHTEATGSTNHRAIWLEHGSSCGQSSPFQ